MQCTPMERSKLQALAAELAKDIKTEADLNALSRELLKLTVETALGVIKIGSSADGAVDGVSVTEPRVESPASLDCMTAIGKPRCPSVGCVTLDGHDGRHGRRPRVETGLRAAQRETTCVDGFPWEP